MSIAISRGSEATVSFTTPQEVIINKNDDSIEVFQANPDNLNANANIQVANTDVSNANPVPVSDAGGSLTVDGTVAATQSGTWNLNNISGTVSLPTGASTAALQTTGNTSLSSINGKLNSLGQKTAAASMPVVLASDQPTLPTSQVGYSTASNTTPTITNASSVVLAANAARKNAYVFNQTGVVVYLKLGTAAVLNEGIRLVNNSMYEINSSNLWLGSINAIKSGAAGVALDIFEGT